MRARRRLLFAPYRASCLEWSLLLRIRACRCTGIKLARRKGTKAGMATAPVPEKTARESRRYPVMNVEVWGVTGTMPTKAPTRAPIVLLVRGSVVLCDDKRRPWGKAPASPFAKTACKQVSFGIRADARPGAGGRW